MEGGSVMFWLLRNRAHEQTANVYKSDMMKPQSATY